MINCQVCNKEMKGEYRDYSCCSGYMCGCMGQPTEPIACSMWCYCYAYHIREGLLSVVINYLHTVFINTSIGKAYTKYKFNKSFKKFKLK